MKKACHSAISGSASGKKHSAFCILHSAFPRGFTLVELLVVISIIAILAGMVMPMFYSSKERAREAKAKVAVKALETAFKSYLDTYKVWPAAWAGAAAPIDGEVFRTLRGDNLLNRNPQVIAFFEFENFTNTTMDATTAWDPWSNPSADSATWKAYYFAFDIDYDNKINLGGPDINRSVVVWSVGKDRNQDFGDGDDVASWR